MYISLAISPRGRPGAELAHPGVAQQHVARLGRGQAGLHADLGDGRAAHAARERARRPGRAALRGEARPRVDRLRLRRRQRGSCGGRRGRGTYVRIKYKIEIC